MVGWTRRLPCICEWPTARSRRLPRLQASAGRGVLLANGWVWALYALNATTGAKIWSYPTGGFITASPVVVNNTVLFGSHG